MVFTLKTSPENFKIMLEVMNRKGDFNAYFDAYFIDDLEFLVTFENEEISFHTHYYFQPLKDGTTRLDIRNVFSADGIVVSEKPIGYENKFTGWDEIRKELVKNSIEVVNTTGFETAVIHGHSYVDPSTITNINHRKVVRALIEAELSPVKVTQKEVAERVGYSQNQVSTIARLYRKKGD